MKNNSPLQYRILRKEYKNAARGMCFDCKDFIPTDSNILDLGCGSGIVGLEFSKEFKSDLLGVDIIDNRVEDIPFKLFNGKNLSFIPDNSFETVLVNYVLHHSENPVELLSEAKRVSKSRIIVYENIPEGIISKISCMLHGISFAWLFQKNSAIGTFFTEKEWRGIFEKLGLKVVHSKALPRDLNPMKEQLFILEK